MTRDNILARGGLRPARADLGCAPVHWAVLVCAIAGAGAGLAAPAACRAESRHYVGVAYAVRGGHEIYREEHWVYDDKGQETRLVLYRCPSGQPFARKFVNGTQGTATPDFEFVDGRDGYREGVRGAGRDRTVYVQKPPSQTARSITLALPPGAMIDTGFDSYVRGHWAELAAKKDLMVQFLVPSRFEFLNLKLANASDGELDGKPVRRFHMSLAAWFSFIAPAIDLTYTTAEHRLRRFEGISNIRDSAGREQNVRIEFTASGRFAAPAEQAMHAAAAIPLVSACPR